MSLYFAYGSNLDVQQMQHRCAEAVRLVAPGCLRGYTLAFNAYASSWGGGVADVVIAPQQEYLGILQRAARCFDFPEAYRVFLDGIATRPDHRQC